MTASAAAASRAPAWGALADALGHCVLVFAFLPTLAALPRWLAFEATNTLNLHDPVVLAFLPVRGGLLLLSALEEGLVPGIVAGVIAGMLVCAWARWQPEPRTPSFRLLLGAAGGFCAAGLMLLTTMAWARAAGRSLTVPTATLAFELASGAVCGLVAISGALRLARQGRVVPSPSASASQT
ncbi:MAG: hypothetical protein ABI080_09395 [Candidatus Binatia bacterium]